MNRFSTLPHTAFGSLAAPQGVITAAGLRQSIHRPTDIITQDQIPAGAQIVRIENPAQYIHHEPTPVVQEVIQTPHHVPQHHGCSDCCYPGHATGVASNISRTAQNGAHAVRNACPWWLWLILGLIGLFLLAGVVYGLIYACGGFAKSAWEGTKDAASGAWEGAKRFGRAAGEVTGKAASGVADGVKNVADSTGRVASGAWEGTKNIASGAWEGAKNVGKAAG